MTKATRLPWQPMETVSGKSPTRGDMLLEFNERTGLSVTMDCLGGDTGLIQSPPLASLPDPRGDERLLFYPEDYEVTEEDAIRHHFNLYWRWETAGLSQAERRPNRNGALKRRKEVESLLSDVRGTSECLFRELLSLCNLSPDSVFGDEVGRVHVGDVGKRDSIRPMENSSDIIEAREKRTHREQWDLAVREVERGGPVQPDTSADPGLLAIWRKLFVEFGVPDDAPIARKYDLLLHLRSALPLLESRLADAKQLEEFLKNSPSKGGRHKDSDVAGRRALVRRLACVRKGRFARHIPVAEVFGTGSGLKWPELPCLTGPRMSLPLHESSDPHELVIQKNGRPLTREDLFIHFVLSCRSGDRTANGAFLEPADIALLLQISGAEITLTESVIQWVRDDVKWLYRRHR